VKQAVTILPLFCLSIMLTEGVGYSQEVPPETKPSVTVTAKAPPPYRDPFAYLEPDPLLNSRMSGGLYRNDFFGFSYQLPKGWIAEETQITKKRDKGETVRAEPLGSTLTAQTVRILGPVILLNATTADVANRARLTSPFVSISVNPSGNEPLSVESIKHSLESGESLRRREGIRLLSGPVETTIGGHPFFRTDFKEISDNSIIWKTFFKTSIHGGVLIVNFCARSKAELDQFLTTMQSFAFDASEPASAGPVNPKP
jgi:hypothetical protein